MKETFPPPEDRTQKDLPDDTRNIGAVPELKPVPKPTRSLEGKTIEPDFRIDLRAPDAMQRLDELAEEVDARKAKDPDSYRDNQYPTEAELEQERLEDEGPKDPDMEPLETAPGVSDEMAKKIREENSAPSDEEDEWDEPTVVDPPRKDEPR